MRFSVLRWFAIVAWLVVFAFSLVSCLGISLSTDYTIFFSPNDPERIAFNEMESRFSQSDNFIFVLRNPDEDVFTRETLSVVERLTEKSKEIPFAQRVDSVANFPRALSTDEELHVSPLAAQAEHLRDQELQDVRQFASAEPLLRGGLLSEDLHTTGVVVTLELPREDPMEVRQATAVARRLLEETRQAAPDLDIRLSGLAAMNDAFMGVSIDDLITVVPFVYVGIFFLLVFLLRSIGATLAIGAVVAISCAATMAVAGLFSFPLTPPSASASTVVMTLAIARLRAPLCGRASRASARLHWAASDFASDERNLLAHLSHQHDHHRWLSCAQLRRVGAVLAPRQYDRSGHCGRIRCQSNSLSDSSFVCAN